MKRTISFSIILAGFTAMVSQIIFVREFLVTFYGNELSIGFILASWLIGGAIGSWFLGGVADRIRDRLGIFSLCQLVLAVLLPSSIFAIRSIKPIFNINAGEIMPIFPIAVSSFVIVVPTCAILGFLFSLGCRIYEAEYDTAAVRIGKVYVLEAVGSMVGGLVASYVLISLLDSFKIIGILSFLNALTAFSLRRSLRSSLIFIIAVAMWLVNGWAGLNKYSLDRQWCTYQLVSSEDSVYGNVAVAKRGAQVSFFGNGIHLYTVPDRQPSEEGVHFAMLEHPDPKDVLLVGGGVGGLVSEVIKHPVKRVDYVELDPLVIKMAKRYLPQEHYEPLEDARVSVKLEDGRFFIKTTNRLYDCLIIHIGDPYTAQLNRYYTAEFFREAKRILKSGGIISFGLSSSENYIKSELGVFLNSVYRTLKEVFGDVLVIPGDVAYFLASDRKGLLTYDYGILMARAGERNLDIKYVREYYLFSKLSPQRISYVENSVMKTAPGGINHDFKPVSYYYDTIFWTTYFKNSIFTRMLKAATERNIWKIAFAVYALILLSGFSFGRYGGSFKNGALTAVAVTGFSGMAFQVVILLAFQAIYGYLFYKLAAILTSFMIGLAIGGASVIKLMPKLKEDRRAFLWAQSAFCVYPLILLAFFSWFSVSKSGVTSWLGSNVYFALLPVIGGFIGGFQFPLANKIWLGREEEAGRVAGLNYGVDLFGACLAALLTGAFLIPILGVAETCFALAALNLAVLIMLYLLRRK